MAKTILYVLGGALLVFFGLHLLMSLINLLVLAGIAIGIVWLLYWALSKMFTSGQKKLKVNKAASKNARLQKKRAEKLLKEQRKARERAKQQALTQRTDVNSQYIRPIKKVQSERIYKGR